MQDRDSPKGPASNSEKDINDVFSDIFLSEENIVKTSYEEGVKIGKSEGNVEGFHLGYHRGAEIGAEIGFYTGVVQTYLTHYEKQDSEKVTKELSRLKTLLADFPKSNDPKVDFTQLISDIRAHFKKVCAILKIQPNFPETDQFSF